jgi:hypothetical protein
MPLTDHLDVCGIPPILSKLRVLLGMEFRQQFWINTFNRIRSLEVDDQILVADINSDNTEKFIK